MNDKFQLGQAFELAFAAHQGQTDKANQPYITHLVRVASRLETPDEQTVALLHDILEDTDTARETLEAVFRDDIVEAVVALTKRDGETYDSYLAKVAAHPLSLQVKRADIADNSDPDRLARLDENQQERLKNKYTAALARLNELSEGLTC